MERLSMKRFQDFLASQEEWLLQRVLLYSGEDTCIGDASSPESPWLLGIRTLSAALSSAFKTSREVLSPRHGEDFSQDPIVLFFVMEARGRHLKGSEPGKCLAFLKCYRQAYLDLFQEGDEEKDRGTYRRLVEVYFDHLEVGFFTQWAMMARGQLMTDVELCERAQQQSLETDRRSSEARYRELFDNMKSGVVVYESARDGADFILKDFNRAIERIDRIERATVIGRSVVEIFPGIRRFGLFDVLQRVWQTGVPERLPMALYQDERISGWRETYVCRLPSGEVAAIYDDVTEQVGAQAALAAETERLLVTLRSISDGVITADTTGRVVMFNEAAENLTGWREQEAVGRPLDEVLHIIDPDSGEVRTDLVQQILTGRIMVGPEHHSLAVKRDRSEISIALSVAPMRDSAGVVSGVVVAFRDTTESRRAAEAIMRSRDSYLKMFDESPTLIWRSGNDGRCHSFNNTWQRFTGRDVAQDLGYGWIENIHPDDATRCTQVYEKAFRTRQSFEMEFRLRRFDGEDRWIIGTGRPFHELDGSFGGFICSGYDITERRRAEEVLRNSEQRFRYLYEQAPLGYQSLDAEGRLIEVNKAWSDFFGYTHDEVIGRSFGEFLTAAGQHQFAECFAGFNGQGEMQGLEIEVVRKDQSRAVVAFYGSVGRGEQGQFRQAHCIFQDISDHKRAKIALRESEERFRSAFHCAATGMALVGLDGRFLQVNRSLCEMVGYSEEELLSQTWQALTYPEDLDANLDLIRRMLSEDGLAEQSEKRYLHKTGNAVWAQESISLLRDGTGQPLYLIAQFQDISQRKRAEQDRTLLAIAAEQSVESITMIDREGVVRYANFAFERIHGRRREDAVGQHFRHLLGDDSAEPLYFAMWEALNRGDTWLGHISEKGRDGQPRELDTSVSPIRDASGDVIHYVVVQRDETQERSMERQLRQAQKMEAIGTLAGGIAHDFNNILAAIIGYTEMVLFKSTKDSPIRRNLEQVLKAGNRAKELVKQILAFSRQSEQELKPIQISIIIKEALKLLRASLPTTVEIRQHISGKTGLVLADPTQIQQVVMNLCANAAHAMRASGGVLEVTVEEVELDGKALARHAELSPGHYLRLTVRDSGHGMNPEIMARIFDPFFSTKIPGEGTGMGLAVVHGIVKSHGGAIDVSSKVGEGTTFHIFFPRLESGAMAKTKPAAPIPRGTERILLVDDEEAMVDMGRQMLTHLGYQVVAQNNSREALRLFSRDPHQFNLVITDQTMPHMTGTELSRAILAVRPDMPIILCTGFSEVIAAEEAKAQGIREFVLKPILTLELATTIRRILDDSESQAKAI
jgi:PAS domain S-box-containing protein